MMDERSVRPHTVSVVVTAEFHNPSILNPDFLASRGISPKNWTVTETVTTPPVAVVKYDSGVEWTVDQSRLTIMETCGPAFADHYSIHDLATAYLDKLPHVPYRSLGLNCQMSMLEANPQRWLVERFAVDWLRNDPQLRGLRPAFALDAGDAVCNISLAESTRDGAPCVAAECNLHHQGPLNVDGLKSAIARWAERRQLIVSTLHRLYGIACT